MFNTNKIQLPEEASTQLEAKSTEMVSVSDIEHRLRRMSLSIEVLLRQSRLGLLSVNDYVEAVNFLEALPLATDEFQLAKLRLRNGQAYCREREFGAAAFELRLMRSQLQHLRAE